MCVLVNHVTSDLALHNVFVLHISRSMSAQITTVDWSVGDCEYCYCYDDNWPLSYPIAAILLNN